MKPDGRGFAAEGGGGLTWRMPGCDVATRRMAAAAGARVEWIGPCRVGRMSGESEAVARSPFLERVRLALRVRHYSERTVGSYVRWVRRYVVFHGRRHPQELGAREVVTFLEHLAVEDAVSASTQNQALAALLFRKRFTDPTF
jgi:hypothetical protein